MRIGVVTGLQREARIARRAGLAVACDGPGPEPARRAAMRLADDGAEMLVSFGYAGGLDPALRPGTLVTGTLVVDVRGWSWQCVALPGRSVPATIVGVDEPAMDGRAKAALRRLGAAVDQESHAVAAVAADRAMPMAVLRVVVDDATTAIPPTAAAAVDAAGRSRPGLVVLGLLRRPWELPALHRLASAVGRADRALAWGAELLAALSANRNAPPPR